MRPEDWALHRSPEPHQLRAPGKSQSSLVASCSRGCAPCAPPAAVGRFAGTMPVECPMHRRPSVQEKLMFVSLGKNDKDSVGGRAPAMPRGWASTSHRTTKVPPPQPFEGEMIVSHWAGEEIEAQKCQAI